ncbi:hypothetical protein PRIPAC_94435 [Pristionchus pacificus]|uniref:Uncharacterized protein n=1 Tax=Pristionchus pacificus TaxID=54126 RepID=A0A2A6BA41_PRIPA|nr:hypothetical protein PRIPAC_94435 [Pristionchus pacificus]|eukprot:PDM62733.1 hypothetical protein PRIPAC_49948 [Pristionchus pacificus]
MDLLLIDGLECETATLADPQSSLNRNAQFLKWENTHYEVTTSIVYDISGPRNTHSEIFHIPFGWSIIHLSPLLLPGNVETGNVWTWEDT